MASTVIWQIHGYGPGDLGDEVATYVDNCRGYTCWAVCTVWHGGTVYAAALVTWRGIGWPYPKSPGPRLATSGPVGSTGGTRCPP